MGDQYREESIYFIIIFVIVIILLLFILLLLELSDVSLLFFSSFTPSPSINYFLTFFSLSNLYIQPFL